MLRLRADEHQRDEHDTEKQACSPIPSSKIGLHIQLRDERTREMRRRFLLLDDSGELSGAR
jgi:hypothetical protein